MNDDFLTVNSNTAGKIVRSYTKKFEEWACFLKTLLDDYRLAKRTAAAQPKIQFLRRIQIRNFCALVEAQTHVWKLLTQEFHCRLRAQLTEGEISMISEKGYDLDDKGGIQSKQLHLQTIKNFMFSSKMFAKVFCCSKQMDFSKEGWVCVKEIFKIRDRLMHPKFAKGVEVADHEMAKLEMAEKWFLAESDALFNCQEDFNAILKRKQPLELLN